MKMECNDNLEFAKEFWPFFCSLFELIIENFALRNFTSYKDIPLNDLCYLVNTLKPYYNNGKINPPAYNYSKKQLKKLIDLCSEILKRVEPEHSVDSLIRNFYLEKMSVDVFDMNICLSYIDFKPIVNKNGFPINVSDKLEQYIISLFTFFNSLCQIKPEKTYIDELPMELRINFYTGIQRKIAMVLENIILEKNHEGICLTGFFFYKVPEFKKTTHSLLLNKTFLKLCSDDLNDFILINDNINSFDFKLAVLDLITFKDKSNKIIFDNKIAQFKNNITIK